MFQFFKGNIHCQILDPVPRTMLHEIVTTLSIVSLQCAVVTRKYTVVKHQKGAFGKAPTMRPNTVDAWGRLVPLISFLLPCQSVDEYMPFLPSRGYAYAGLDHSDVFLIQKCMKFMKIFLCVSAKILIT